jgi:hypothetical protein
MKQLNSIPNRSGIFLDLIFSNSSSDIGIKVSDDPLLKLDRHHEAYEVCVEITADRYEPCLDDEERYNFFLADCDSIIQDLRSIEWTGLFSCKKVDQCVDIFYDVIEIFFNKNVPQSRSKRNSKLPWHSKNVHVLKNRSNLAAKKLKQSEICCLTNPLIDECTLKIPMLICVQTSTQICVGPSEHKFVFVGCTFLQFV